MMLVLRSFKVTQGQKLASKGQKGQISIFIKSSWNLHEKEALNVSFSVKWVKVIQVPTNQKLTEKGQKGLFVLFVVFLLLNIFFIEIRIVGCEI